MGINQSQADVEPLFVSKPCARPTNDISIEFKIRPNFAVLWF